MLIFKWDQNLELGMDLIDRQHKEILKHANLFFISYKGGEPKAQIRECLSFLQQYVLYHFQAEEAYQVKCGYPGYRDHQVQHQELGMKFKFQSTQLISSDFSQQSIDAFYEFLRGWIIVHILTEDSQFAAYYREHSEAAGWDRTEGREKSDGK